LKFVEPSDSLVACQCGLPISTLRGQFMGVILPFENEILIDFGGFSLFKAYQMK